MYREGKLSSCHEGESFGRRYAAVCEELGISPRSWDFGMFGPEFYDLYKPPRRFSECGPPSPWTRGLERRHARRLRTKLPGSVVTSFPWHQDSQYFDQLTIGKKEKHTGGMRMVTVWLPLVEATVENGCCWVLPGSHRWGLLDGVRGADLNVRMEEDVEARGTPVPVPLEPGGALFLSNLCVHTSKMNRTKECRWSIDFRYFPAPDRADLTAGERQAAEYAKKQDPGGRQGSPCRSHRRPQADLGRMGSRERKIGLNPTPLRELRVKRIHIDILKRLYRSDFEERYGLGARAA